MDLPDVHRFAQTRNITEQQVYIAGTGIITT